VKAVPVKAAKKVAPAEAPQVRPELMRAKSLPTLRAAAEAEAERVTGRGSIGLFKLEPGWSLETAREHIEGILRGLARYPQADFGGLRKQVRALASGQFFLRAHRLNGVIEVGDEFATKRGRDAYLARIMRNRDRHWWAQAVDSPTGLAAHEFGHVIVDATLGVGRVHARVKELVARMAADAGIPERRFVYDQLSDYATQDTDELIGEAFADVLMRGEAASPLARGIIAIIDDEYVSRGFRLGRLTP